MGETKFGPTIITNLMRKQNLDQYQFLETAQLMIPRLWKSHSLTMLQGFPLRAFSGQTADKPWNEKPVVTFHQYSRK